MNTAKGYYAGIGSRETPLAIQFVMMHIAIAMANAGFVLRSGAANGADKAFENGCDKVSGPKEIYLPWSGFNGRKSSEDSVMVGANDYTAEIAAEHHPNWSACSNGAKSLHARNVCQVLGFSRARSSSMVICWTPNASGSGGTGQAIRIAQAYNIPVYDIADDAVLTSILKGLNLV